MDVEYQEGIDNAIYWGKSQGHSTREVGPSNVFQTGVVFFSVINHNLSRRVGPAVIYPNGRVGFYEKPGSLHRTTGPAMIDANGSKQYRINNREVPELEYFATYGVL